MISSRFKIEASRITLRGYMTSQQFAPSLRLAKEESYVTIQVLRMALPGFRGVKNVRVSSEGEKVLLCRLADPGGQMIPSGETDV
jgi:hypothetical protein